MKKVIVGLVVILALFIVFVSLQPSQYVVERSILVQAPVAKIEKHIADFHQWKAWSPWFKLDPNMTLTFSGASKGVGAKYAWAGNDEVGAGNMTITHQTPTQIDMQLNFEKPWKATALTQFIFTPVDHETKVTWRMSGEKNFMSKLFTIFQSMDSMVGPDFERGLNNLNTVVK